MTIPTPAQAVLFQDAVARDRTTARRALLLELLLQERYLSREQLIVRVEDRLGRDCFGQAAWQDTFYRDMRMVKRALQAAGDLVRYSRSAQNPGYYLRNRPRLHPDLSKMLAGALAEVDPAQLRIFQQLSCAQRFQQGCSISNLARQVVAFRARQSSVHPET